MVMGVVCNNLGQELKSLLNKADEIWVAVALISEYGLNFIQKNSPKGIKQNYLLGIDLPTDPKALIKLSNQQTLSDVNVGMYTEMQFYHPKVYIVRTRKLFTAFVGSANCTKRGLSSNIEMSVLITNQEECKRLLDWYEILNANP